MTDKPHLRFNPNAYEHGAFEASSEICDACERACVWKFAGLVYTEAPDPIVCARCIADGNLATIVGEYGLHDMDFTSGDVDEALTDEVNRRTPGFTTWNAFAWPVIDKQPLAFFGYGDDAALTTNPAVMAAAARLAEAMDDADIDPSNMLMFKPLDGEDYVAVLDLD